MPGPKSFEGNRGLEDIKKPDKGPQKPAFGEQLNQTFKGVEKTEEALKQVEQKETPTGDQADTGKKPAKKVKYGKVPEPERQAKMDKVEAIVQKDGKLDLQHWAKYVLTGSGLDSGLGAQVIKYLGKPDTNLADIQKKNPNAAKVIASYQGADAKFPRDEKGSITDIDAWGESTSQALVKAIVEYS